MRKIARKQQNVEDVRQFEEIDNPNCSFYKKPVSHDNSEQILKKNSRKEQKLS